MEGKGRGERREAPVVEAPELAREGIDGGCDSAHNFQQGHAILENRGGAGTTRIILQVHPTGMPNGYRFFANRFTPRVLSSFRILVYLIEVLQKLEYRFIGGSVVWAGR